MGFTWAYIHAKKKCRSKYERKEKKNYNDNKDKVLSQSKQYNHDNGELILKFHALTNHIYIERRRHDCEFRRKQRQYYILIYNILSKTKRKT